MVIITQSQVYLDAMLIEAVKLSSTVKSHCHPERPQRPRKCRMPYARNEAMRFVKIWAAQKDGAFRQVPIFIIIAQVEHHLQGANISLDSSESYHHDLDALTSGVKPLCIFGNGKLYISVYCTEYYTLHHTKPQHHNILYQIPKDVVQYLVSWKHQYIINQVCVFFSWFND